MQYLHGTELKLKSHSPRSVTSQVPERIDSLDNNNPLKIYTKLTSARVQVLIHSMHQPSDESRKKMFTDGPTISLLNSVGCCSLNMLMQRNLQRLVLCSIGHKECSVRNSENETLSEQYDFHFAFSFRRMREHIFGMFNEVFDSNNPRMAWLDAFIVRTDDIKGTCNAVNLFAKYCAGF